MAETYNGVPVQELYTVWEKVQKDEAEARLRKMEAARRARAKYREAHKEEHRELNRQYYENHRDEILERRRVSTAQ
jgi:hypothetical protein